MQTEESGPGMAEVVSYLEERASNISRYSDKLSEALREIDTYFEKVGPKVGIRFIDSEPFYEETNPNEGKISYYLMVAKDWGLYAKSNCEYIDSKLIAHASRAMKKAAVVRLPEFMKLYAEAARKTESEFEDVSKKATQIAAIMQAPED